MEEYYQIEVGYNYVFRISFDYDRFPSAIQMSTVSCSGEQQVK